MKMFERLASKTLLSLNRQFPVLLVTGPRQSGKTTLVRALFPEKPYVNLEGLQAREFAETDPVGFMNQFPEGAVLDEVQRVPKLLSEVQVRVDQSGANGAYVLTGSHQGDLHSAVAQSLAGRVALFRLLPLSIEEIPCGSSIDATLYRGFYPRVVAHALNPTQANSSYVETYAERDVRQILQIKDLSAFQKFLKICAGRIGQLLNLEQLGNDADVSATTARHWLSVLESSFILYTLKPFYKNTTKRLVKSPKLYFYDVGIASFLLGIESESHWHTHPLRGQLFENLIVSEFIKARWNRGLREQLFFYRDQSGNEVDLVVEVGGKYLPIEIKSSQTFHKDFLKGFTALDKLLQGPTQSRKAVIYGGEASQDRSEGKLISWRSLPSLFRSEVDFFPEM